MESDSIPIVAASCLGSILKTESLQHCGEGAAKYVAVFGIPTRAVSIMRVWEHRGTPWLYHWGNTSIDCKTPKRLLSSEPEAKSEGEENTSADSGMASV